MSYIIDKVYGVPKEDVSCPGCGLRYGHHNTQVDTISQECSACCKQMNRAEAELMPASQYIEQVLGLQPLQS